MSRVVVVGEDVEITEVDSGAINTGFVLLVRTGSSM